MREAERKLAAERVKHLEVLDRVRLEQAHTINENRQECQSSIAILEVQLEQLRRNSETPSPAGRRTFTTP
jgi:hypothetical protein